MDIQRISNNSYRTTAADDFVEVNCTSRRSKPAAALEWYVDGVKVRGHHLIEYAPMVDDDEGGLLETSVLGLRWRMAVGDSSAVLNCTAAVSSVYWRWTSLTILRENKPPERIQQSNLTTTTKMSYRESRLFASPSSSSSSTLSGRNVVVFVICTLLLVI